jgi:hypothetical protein
MKQLVIPNEVRNLALVPFCSRNNARFLTSFAMTALLQGGDESRSASGRIAEQRRRVRFLASPSKVKARVGGTPSPGPPRLKKAPAAAHPLPQGGEGLSSPWVGLMAMRTWNDTEFKGKLYLSGISS